MTDNNDISQLKTQLEFLQRAQIMLMENSLKDRMDIEEVKKVLIVLMMKTDPEIKAALEKAKAECECEKCKPETAAPAAPTENQ